MDRIAVIGGGAAGIAAAWRLCAAGARVTLFEGAAQLGGRARSEELDGCIVDTGAQLFGSGFSTLFKLAREAGAEKLLIRSPGRDAVYRGGRIHPITYGSVSSMVRSSALPVRLKLRLGAHYVPFLLRHNRLDANDPAGTGGDLLDTASVSEWGAAELGKDFVEMLAAPLLGAYYGSAPEQVSVALYHALASAGLDVSVYAVRGGTGALLNAIADKLIERGCDVRLGTEVRQVEQTDSGFRVASNAGSENFDAVILAVPAPRVFDVVQLPAEVVAWLEQVEYAPAAVLALVLNGPVNADFFGLSLLRADEELSDLVAICVEDAKAGELVPKHHGLLVCLGSPASNRRHLENAEAAVERMIAVTEKVFPGTRQRILRAKLYRHITGYPVFYPGYIKHLRAYPAAILPSGLRLAGDYLVAPTVEGAMRSGERAAEEMLRYRAAR